MFEKNKKDIKNKKRQFTIESEESQISNSSIATTSQELINIDNIDQSTLDSSIVYNSSFVSQQTVLREDIEFISQQTKQICDMIRNILHMKLQFMITNTIDFILQTQMIAFTKDRTSAISSISAILAFDDDDDSFDSSVIQLYYTSSIKSLLIEQMRYFDSDYKKKRQTTMFFSIIESMISANKHVYYKDVYVFVDRLKNLKSQHEHQLMRNVLKSCLRDDVQY